MQSVENQVHLEDPIVTIKLSSLVRNNKLAETQASGNFYNTNYLKDAINHFSDPPYVTIKPGYRSGMPAPTDN